jgi:hypothetical protein
VGTYNTVENVTAKCPSCGTQHYSGVQFKYGSRNLLVYNIGDKLIWGANDIGKRDADAVVVDGEFDGRCSSCGYNGFWPIYVFILGDTIVACTNADNRYSFVGTEGFLLIDDCDGVPELANARSPK